MIYTYIMTKRVNTQSYTLCSFPCDERSIRLHLNEFRFPHSESVKQSVRDFVDDPSLDQFLSGYTIDSSECLIENIKRIHQIPNAHVCISAGSDEILRAVINTSSHRNHDKLLIGLPTYTHFEHYADLEPLKICSYMIGHSSSTETHFNQLLYYDELMRVGCLVYLGNPNNPVGHVWKLEYLEMLLIRFPRSLFLVDEAYIEFSSIDTVGNFSLSSVHLATKYSNIIVSKTFSKAFGLAALRVGYAVASVELIQQLTVPLNPKSVNRLDITTANAVLNDVDYYVDRVRDVMRNKKTMIRLFAKYNFSVIDSAANFFSVFVGSNVSKMLTHMYMHNIHVRDRSKLAEMNGFVRITAGNDKDVEILTRAVRTYVSIHGVELYANSIYNFYTPKDRIADLKILFKNVASVLNELGIQYWVTDGTLLGAIRHGGIIPWDDDFDIGFLELESNSLEQISLRISEFGYVIQKNRTGAYWQIGDNPEGERISMNHIDLFLFKLDLRTQQYVCCDVRYRQPDVEGVTCNLTFSRNELFPLRQVAFYDLTVPIPNESEKLLDRAFAPNDWRAAAKIRRTNLPPLSFDLEDFGAA